MDTATRTRPGWYYVGAGELRFRDDEDWTDHVLVAEDIRGHDWPPPDPRARGGEVKQIVLTRPATKRSRFGVRRMLQGAS